MLEMTEATMGQALHLVTVQRGFDPRDFTLIAFGGGGPLHAVGLAERLGITRVSIPPDPGVLSAYGLLVSEMRREIRATRVLPFDPASASATIETIEVLKRKGRTALDTDGIDRAQQRLRCLLDVRYVGQGWTLPVEIGEGAIDETSFAALRAAFDAAHEATYGYRIDNAPAEIVNVTGEAYSVRDVRRPERVNQIEPSEPGRRRIYFGQAAGWANSNVVRRPSRVIGWAIAGPAAIESDDSTILVPPAWTATIDENDHVNLVRMSHEQRQSHQLRSRLSFARG